MLILWRWTLTKIFLLCPAFCVARQNRNLKNNITVVYCPINCYLNLFFQIYFWALTHKSVPSFFIWHFVHIYLLWYLLHNCVKIPCIRDCFSTWTMHLEKCTASCSFFSLWKLVCFLACVCVYIYSSADLEGREEGSKEGKKEGDFI